MELTGPTVALGIFLLGQLLGAVAWAAAINTKMNFMITASMEFHKARETYSTKEEVSKAFVVSEKNLAVALDTADKNIAAMWKQIDALKARI